MRKALILLGLLFWPGIASGQNPVGPANQILCDKTATFSGVATSTVLVPAVAGQTVFICGWHVTNNAATTSTFALSSGTQTTTPCDTGTKTITPGLFVTQSAPSADHINYAATSSNQSQALCVTPSAVTVSGLVYYSQF